MIRIRPPCHRRRVPDRLCFRGILIQLVTGSSWVDVEAILNHQVSDTTLRSRRDEWIDACVVDQLKSEALPAFDRIVGLDLENVSIGGSLHVVVQVRTIPTQHRPAITTPTRPLGLATAPVLIIRRLSDYRDRWSPSADAYPLRS